VDYVTDSNRLKIMNLVMLSLYSGEVQSLIRSNSQTLGIKSEDYIIQNFLPHAINYLLETFYWQFATRSTPLIEDAKGGGYYLPPDFQRFVGVGYDGCNCCCCFSPSGIGGTPSSDNIIAETNKFLQEKNSDRYISSVSFDIVNNRFNFHIQNEFLKDGYFVNRENVSKLFYISNAFDDMRVPERFNKACAEYIIATQYGRANHDPQAIGSTTLYKRYLSTLYTAIEEEFKEFKYRINYTERDENCGKQKPYLGFTQSPF